MISLHKIFRYLVNDDNFMISIIETSVKEDSKKNKMYQIMHDVVTEYRVLQPEETQKYIYLPYDLKAILPPKFHRMGVISTKETLTNDKLNISFLTSLNVLLRPELRQMTQDNNLQHLNILQKFIEHKIKLNFSIDQHIYKIKNTPKVKKANLEIIEQLLKSTMTPVLIQYIVNIFEINLLIFDFIKMEFVLYWCKGKQYPFLNLFRDIYVLGCLHGFYEPIVMNEDVSLTDKERITIYCNILENIDPKTNPKIVTGCQSLFYLNSQPIPPKTYTTIISKFFPTKKYI